MAKVYGGFAANTIQLGRETTPGTLVAATTKWRGPFSHIQDPSERTTVEEQIGLLVQGERTYQSAVGGQLTMPDTEMTFEQLLHLYEAGCQTVTPTGAGPYVYEYAYSITNTANVIKTYSLQSGNVLVPTDNLKMKFGFVESMTFSGAAGEAWKMGSTWRGHQPSIATLTPSIAAPTGTEVVLFPKTKLYIDDSGGTIHSTQLLGVLMGAQIQINTGIRAVPVGDGSLNFAAYKWTLPVITFSITIELEEDTGVSTVADERAHQVAGNVRLFSLDVPGSSATRNVRWDFAGVYDSVGDYENTDGNTTVTLSGHSVYSSADALFFETVITNNLSAVP